MIGVCPFPCTVGSATSRYVPGDLLDAAHRYDGRVGELVGYWDMVWPYEALNNITFEELQSE